MNKLYKFNWDCGRQGSVDGLFIADEKVIDVALGNEVSFGEILGKHSDVYGYLEECDLAVLDVSETTVDELRNVLGSNISGYNPLDYISYSCSRCEKIVCVEDDMVYLKEDEGAVCIDCCTEEEVSTLTLL